MAEIDETEKNAQHAEEMKALKEEQAAKVRARKDKRGVVIVNTGDGKGKSSSAFGVAIRAAGHGQKVGIVQFIKGTWSTGEQAAFKRFPEIDHIVSGDGFTWNTQDRAQDIASAERGWAIANEMIEASRGEDPKYHVIILDELNIALRYDYLDVAPIAKALAEKPEELSIIVTGRDAKQELIDVADTVTEMTPVKHAWDKGIKARKGIEF